MTDPHLFRQFSDMAPHGDFRRRAVALICGSVCALLFLQFASKVAFSITIRSWSSAVGEALVTGIAGLSLATIIFATHRPTQFRALVQWLVAHHVKLASLFLLLTSGLLAVLFAPIGWDECAHVLTGMWIRGYPVPHEAFRSPLIQWLAALAYPHVNLINPALILILGVVMIAWCRRFSHPGLLLLLVPLLIAHKHFMFSAIDLMGELPAAVSLAAGYYFMACGRFRLCAVCFSLAVLSRWNLAPLTIIPVVFVATRHSLREAAFMGVIGLAFFSTWAAWAAAFVGSPIELLVEYLAISHADVGSVDKITREITPISRLEFYLRVGFYLSPLGFCALLVSPFVPRTNMPTMTASVFQHVMPVSFIVYFLIILFMGNFVPRLMTPLVVPGFLLFAEVVRSLASAAGIPLRTLAIPLVMLVPISASTTMLDYHVAADAARKLLKTPPLPMSFAQEVRAITDPSPIHMPPFYKISRQSGGREVRILLRRNVIIHPDETLTPPKVIYLRTLGEEIRDFEPRVPRFLDQVPDSDFFLLPSPYRNQIPQDWILVDVEGWILGRRVTPAASP